jgi:hypothetical protein
MRIIDKLKHMGWSDAMIARTKCNGKPLSEVEKKAPSKFDGMNKTEAAFAIWLDHLKREGTIVDYWFESVKLRLARKTHYTPDFLVLYPHGKLQFVEIKGGRIWDDAAVKFKTAREKYPMFQWVCWQKTKSGWKEIYT